MPEKFVRLQVPKDLGDRQVTVALESVPSWESLGYSRLKDEDYTEDISVDPDLQAQLNEGEWRNPVEEGATVVPPPPPAVEPPVLGDIPPMIFQKKDEAPAEDAE